jgi:uncharacterized protein
MKKRHWISGLLLAVVLIAGLLLGATYYLWELEFHTHYDTDEATSYSVDEFAGVECESMTFASDCGQELAGYLYTCDDVEPSGLIVMAHGFGGGGHNSYMPIAAYFARAGFYVFAYDSTGHDASGGGDIKGLPQGIIDLDYAISYAESLPQLKDQPVFLIGHSWGAYCACSVPEYHPEVRAVVSMSGFNSSTDLIRAQARGAAGILGDALVPFAKLIEKVKLGSYSDCSAMTGFVSSDAAVMVIQGAEDDQVPPSYGYDLYREMYAEDARFTFLLRKNRGHDDVYWSDDAIEYQRDLIARYRKERDSEPEMTDEELAAWRLDYLRRNLDRDVWDNVIDEGLFDSIAEFYRSHA